jgi:hypothetical protein
VTWAIQTGWRFNVVEVVKETDKMVFYIDRSYRERESRQAKHSVLDWRGDEDTAHQIAAKLTSAKAECDRRRAAASKWFDQRRDEILASAMSASGQDPNGLEAKPASATREAGDAQ